MSEPDPLDESLHDHELHDEVVLSTHLIVAINEMDEPPTRDWIDHPLGVQRLLREAGFHGAGVEGRRMRLSRGAAVHRRCGSWPTLSSSASTTKSGARPLQPETLLAGSSLREPTRRRVAHPLDVNEAPVLGGAGTCTGWGRPAEGTAVGYRNEPVA